MLGSYLDGLVGQQMNISTMLDLGMDFMVVPEFTGPGIFTPEEAEKLLEQNSQDDTSILNPGIMYNAYFASITKANQTLMTQTQWSFLSKYLDVQLEAMNLHQAEGQLLSKVVTLGYEVLNTTLPMEYATRNLAHAINYGTP